MTMTTDIAVIGAGPAGANAALTAATYGFSVTLLDEQPKPGGQIWRAKSAAILEAPTTPESTAGDTLRQAIEESTVNFLGNRRVWQIERDGAIWVLQVLCDGQATQLRVKALVIATGAREYVQPVPGWTTPGVLGLAGATALFKQELTVPGQKTIVSGTGPLVFFVASEIRRLGGEVVAVITPNGRRDWFRALPWMLSRPDLLWRGGVWIADLMLNGVPIYWRHAVTKVIGATSVSDVEFCKLDADWAPVGAAKKIIGDSLCLGNGLIPAIEAAQLAGLKTRHEPALGGWIPDIGKDGTSDVDGLFLCGDGGGILGAVAAENHGKLTGLKAAEFLGADTVNKRASLRRKHRRAARFGLAMTGLSIPRNGLAKLTTEQTIVCRCESVTRLDIETEIGDGACGITTVKSGLRAGMGPCGGKFCQTAVAQLIANAGDQPDGQGMVLPQTPRPPLRPLPISAISGDFDYDDLPIPKPAPL